MKKIYFLLMLMMGMSIEYAYGQTVLGGWDFNGLSGFGGGSLAPGTTGSNVSVGSLTRGSGITTAGSGASNGWGADGWDGQTTAAGAITANKFITFTITANSNFAVSLSSISAYNIRRSGTGPTTGLWQYKVGAAGSFIDIGTAITWGGTTTAAGNAQASINLSGIANLQNVASGTVITFRIVNYNASGSGGTWYLNNFQTGNDLVINGSVIPTMPTSQATNIIFSNVQSTQFDFNWTDGNGTKRAVFIAQTNTGTAAPTDNTTYPANTTFATAGSQIGATGWYCVYNSNAVHPTAITVTGLSANTTYRVMVCEYNGNAGSETYNTLTATDNPLNQTTLSGGALTPPTLTAAIGATVDANFDITYTDDPAWRSAVTTVKYGAATLTAGTDYSLSAGILTLKPTGGNPALQVAGTQTVSVIATGYNDATVSQAIGFGTATKLGISIQPAAPLTNGTALATQPVVVVQDQYGNTVTSSTASITAAVGAGTWTIGGTTNQNAAAGIATYTDLTATSAAAQAATIDFTSAGLTHIESNIFNIPAPPTLYTWIGTGTGSWATNTNWSPTGVPTNLDEVLFNGALPVTVTNVPSVTLRSFTSTGTGTVTLQAIGAATLNIGGGTAPQLNLSAGTSLIIDGATANAISINVLTGNTGNISGAVTLQGGAHKLTAADANGITFNSGAIFTAGTAFSGNPFGPAGSTSNSVIFTNGSTYIQQAGSNPFASTQPASIVVFQTGSLFKLQGNLTPSLSGRTYSNFELDFAAALITTTASATVNIDNLTITQGSLNFGATGTFNIKGNIAVASGATLILAPSPAGTLTLNGASPQSISNSGTLTFGTNQSVTVNNTNGVTLNTDVAMGTAGTLTLTNGNVILGSSNLTVSAISGGSATSYISTNGSGALTIRNVTTTKTFPVGNGTSYTPATLTNTGTADDFTVNVAAGTPCNADPFQSVNRVWTITEGTPGGSIADITLQWNQSDENLTFIRLLCAAVHCAGGIVDLKGTNSTAGGSDPYTQTITGVTSFSPFGVTSDNVVLPISIQYFNGYKQSDKHNLSWKINCSSSPSATMTIERSSDGRTYSSIYTITADAVRCLDAFAYTDVNPLPGINYYRLKSVDANGRIAYSIIITLLNKEQGFEIVNITPNPTVNGQFKLNVTTTKQTAMDIIITDMAGRVVDKRTVSLISGFNAVDMNINNLASGTYQLYGNTTEGKTKALGLVKQ